MAPQKEFDRMVVLNVTGGKCVVKKRNKFDIDKPHFAAAKEKVHNEAGECSIIAIELDNKIIAAIAAPPNSCVTVDPEAFVDTRTVGVPIEGDEKHRYLYNPCVRLRSGAWI
jgi:hypothetical protein